MLRDGFNRRINYLRLSITDRCNLRCRYCVTQENFSHRCHSEILSYEDLLRISRAAIRCGIQKIRITGGEPLVRKGVVDFISALKEARGLKELVLTTNGIRLGRYAAALKRAGLKRVNVSLDSLRPAVYANITGGGSLAAVLEGIDSAEDAGLPVKLNMVVMRGVNDAEIRDFAALTLTKNIAVRFIEYMPVGCDANWGNLIVPSEEILDVLARHFTFEPVLANAMSGPSINYEIAGAQGSFGVISPVSGHFCGSCNRIRVTAFGRVRSCLFADHETDLKPALHDLGDRALEAEIERLVCAKPLNHGLDFKGGCEQRVMMSEIGG